MKITIEGDYNDVVIRVIDAESTWNDVLEEVKQMLRGIGYVIDYDYGDENNEN